MKIKILTVILALSLFSIKNAVSAVDSTTMNSTAISGVVTLNSSTTYILKGNTNVINGGVLIIEPGTKIFGDYNTKGTLIIQRGGKIIANGNANNPIVFTSRQSAGQRRAGDWGGIIILGRSAINTSTGVDSAEIEGFGPGLGPVYGGQR